MQESVHCILKLLATTKPRSLVLFEHILTGRITSTSYTPNGTDEESTKELFAILSRLVDSGLIHNGGGFDSSGIFNRCSK